MPFDHSTDSQRAFTDTGDHGFPACLNSFRNCNFTLTGKQLHATHFAQVHTHGIIGAFQGLSRLARWQRHFSTLGYRQFPALSNCALVCRVVAVFRIGLCDLIVSFLCLN